ncbi:alpha/beta fold hydrolase [Corynebacterium sp. 4HC-13]|uniref:alpha/beta fold hydrolase n=1 Tax=Corynebacterium anserum TaxID=2684406 RepID=UPI00163A0F7F|nr:alpha/beta hydrolase [Corynebacterium anserum]MBC2681165.1 alpha/beta fold hydrolase [Corynebacterium anserum]
MSAKSSRLVGAITLSARRTKNRLRKCVPDLPNLRDVHETHYVTVPGTPTGAEVEAVGEKDKPKDPNRPDVKIAVREIVSENYDSSAAETLNIIFAHGFTLSSQSWFFQAERLRHMDNLRMFFPDLRGHGDSPAPPESLGVDETAGDIVEIIKQCAPEGPIMLVGHSMGVMTVLGSLRYMDNATRDRVKGIALINGAIDTFASAGITRILRSPVVRGLRGVGKRFPRRAEKLKNSIEWTLEPFIASFVYHGALEEGASARFDIVEFHAEEIGRTTMTTVLGYLDDLTVHDETPAAPFLQGIPGVVMVGACDDVTPAEQTREIAKVWHDAVKREFPESGHMLPVECPEAVNAELVKLVRVIRGDGTQ